MNKHINKQRYQRRYNYIFANRLPASGYFFYFPWQKEYNDKPVLGVKIDPIKDILEKKPDSKYTLSDKLWGYLQAYAAKHKAAV